MKRGMMILSLVLVFMLSLGACALADDAVLTLHLPETTESKTAEETAEQPEVENPAEIEVLLEVAKGDTLKLDYTAEGVDDWGKITKTTWTTSDKKVATVEKGKVTGKAAGEATITLTLKYKNGQELTASVPVEVYTPVKSLKLDKKSLKMTVGDEATALVVTVNSETAKYQTVTWSSSDTNVAVVDENGSVTAVGGGKAKITATSDQPANSKGKQVSVSCTVTVTQLSGEIKLDKTEATLPKGSSLKLTATVLPTGATNKTVEWKSSNPAVATVSNGKVVAKKAGTATITVTAKDGSGANATCTITVTQPVTSIKLSETKRIVVFVNKSTKVSAIISPSDATNKQVTWSSSDNRIASVDTSGLVTGKRAGTATITATAKDGSGKQKSVTVVVEPLNPITITKLGTGIYQPNLLGITVENLTKTKTIQNFSFDMKLIAYNGSVINSGNFNLGEKNTSVGPGKTRTIKRTASGVGYSSKITITITSVTFSDGTVYRIPVEEQETWSWNLH